MIRLYDNFYDDFACGNSYKVRLLLSQLNRDFERVNVDIGAGQTRTAEFLAVNPNHHIPVVEWPDGRRLMESTAILNYLAEGTEFVPYTTWERAQVLQWQCFEQYSHEPYMAVLRYWYYLGTANENPALRQTKIDGSYHALAVMEQHLSDTEFFVGGRYSIADISLYAFTHVANEGNIELGGFPAVRAWLQRIADQPRHVEILDKTDGQLIQWP